MIHAGAVVAAGVSQGKSTSIKLLNIPSFDNFRNDVEKRVCILKVLGRMDGCGPTSFGSPARTLSRRAWQPVSQPLSVRPLAVRC